MGHRHIIAISATLGIWLAAVGSASARDICLETATADAEDGPGFDKLVRTEVGRHRSHRIVEKGCDGVLQAELVTVGKTTYLTIRMDSDVPVRYHFKDEKDLLEKLTDGVSMVLGSDPEHLMEDVSKYNAAKRMSHSVFVAGHTLWGFEIFETMMRTGRRERTFAPGIAFAASRGADRFALGVKLHVQGWPEDPKTEEPVLTFDAGVDVAIRYAFLARTFATPYVGAGVGIQYFRTEGRIQETDVVEYNDEVMPMLHGRVGILLFRYHDFELDLFASAYLPCMSTGGGGDLFDKTEYTPLIQMGAGVGF